MKPALIGLDIGTTNIKAVAFRLDGSQLAKTSTPTRTHYPRPGWAYFEPAEIWDSICIALRELTARLPQDTTPAAIAFSSMAEAATPLDAAGEPVHASIAWFDKRTQPQADWWEQVVGFDETARITGLPVQPVWGILKLLWIRQHAPDAFARTACWLNMADYGVFQLCGVAATDYSLASRMMVFDLSARAWSQTLLDAIELPHTLLAEPVPSGRLLGRVHAAAARATGLPVGTPVCSGGHDHVCGAFGLGLTEVGDVLDSMGTAEGIVLTTPQLRLEPDVARRGIAQGVHVAPDRTYAMSGLGFSGGAVDWVRRLLLSTLAEERRGEETAKEAFDRLLDLARGVEPGSGGVFFLPHLRRASPPIMDIHTRAAFVGVTSDTTTGHFARAVLEGIAYDYQWAFENMMETFDQQPRQLVATGGGTRNDLLLSIKAQVAGQSIHVPQVEEATCLGAAMLAGIGAGIYGNAADAASLVQHVGRVVESQPPLHRFYRRRYEEIYLDLYEALRTIHHRISQHEAEI